jgi:tetratricopeptide (TPR) repeat protein
MLALITGDAFAADEERARELFEQGVRATARGQWEEGLAAFEKSAALVPRASTEFNIGSALMKLGRTEEAVSHLQRFLEMSDPNADAAPRKKAIEMLAEIDRARRKQPPPDSVDDLGDTTTSTPAEVAEVLPPPPPLIPPPAVTAPIEEEEAGFWTHPAFIATIAAAVVGAAIGVGFAVGSGEGDPLAGNRGVVLTAD